MDISIILHGLLKTSEAGAGDCLQKLLLLPKQVESLLEHLAQGVLHMLGKENLPHEAQS